jgi:threonine/homoserine/homoserine lactone efflux protein
MPADILLATVVFAFVSCITPGPNNFMLLASGVNFGLRRTIPHMAGVVGGFAIMLLAVGFGIGGLLTAFPFLYTGLKIVGAVYLLYLSCRIAMSRSIGDAEGKATPMSFLEAAAFQWVNPKAWATAVAAIALYTIPATPVMSVFVIMLAFLIVNVPSVWLWAGFGIMLRGFLSDPVRLKWFNIAMGVLLAATLWPMLR